MKKIFFSFVLATICHFGSSHAMDIKGATLTVNNQTQHEVMLHGYGKNAQYKVSLNSIKIIEYTGKLSETFGIFIKSLNLGAFLEDDYSNITITETDEHVIFSNNGTEFNKEKKE
jgi:hypothetical protein